MPLLAVSPPSWVVSLPWTACCWGNSSGCLQLQTVLSACLSFLLAASHTFLLVDFPGLFKPAVFCVPFGYRNFGIAFHLLFGLRVPSCLLVPVSRCLWALKPLGFDPASTWALGTSLVQACPTFVTLTPPPPPSQMELEEPQNPERDVDQH